LPIISELILSGPVNDRETFYSPSKLIEETQVVLVK